MNVPRALGRIATRGGHRLSGHLSGRAGGRSARALAYRAAGLIALTPLLLSSLASTAVAAPGAGDSGGQTDGPAPVQILDLTTSSGQATEVAQSGLDDARTSTGSDSGGGTGAETSAIGATGSVRHTVAQAADTAHVRSPLILPVATDPQADATLLTDPLEVDRFLVAGFTWTGGPDLPEGVRIYLRVRENGTWSPWYLNEAADAGRDDRTTSGTGEFVTGGADAIQASVVGGSLPVGLKLALVPSRPQGERVLDADELKTTEAAPTPVIEDAVAQPQAGRSGALESPAELTGQSVSAVTTRLITPASFSTAETAARPASTVPAALPVATSANGLPVPVTTRAEWGANASYMSWDPDYASAGHVVVHHTAGTNNYSAGQSASIVRGI